MRSEGVIGALRFLLALPLVVLMARLLLSINPLVRYLSLATFSPEKIVYVLLVIAVFYLTFEGKSIGKLATLVYLSYFAYLVLTISPFVHTAFPQSQRGFVQLINQYLTMTPKEAFLSMPFLLLISIADDYLLFLQNRGTSLSSLGIPEEDVWDVVYPSLITFALAVVFSLVLFTWILDYVKSKTLYFGSLGYFLPALLLIALGTSISLGLWEKKHTEGTVVVIKTRVPLGKGSSYRLEWVGEPLLLVNPGENAEERELMIVRQVETAPKFIRLIVGEKMDVLRRVKESVDNGNLFVLYSNLPPREI
ncbi:hypothetical protein [Thermococcus sp.]